MQGSTRGEGRLRRDRMIILAGLVSITAFAWAYLLHLTFAMGTMEMAMEMVISMQTWTVSDLVLLFIMWTVMMVAMMVPTATAMILAFATMNRRRRAHEQPYVPTAIFLGGYVVVWTGFSVLATLAQWGLHRAALLSPMMVSNRTTASNVSAFLSPCFPLNEVFTHFAPFWVNSHGPPCDTPDRHVDLPYSSCRLEKPPLNETSRHPAIFFLDTPPPQAYNAEHKSKRAGAGVGSVATVRESILWIM
jgi:predicted metal-binding membrane protein